MEMGYLYNHEVFMNKNSAFLRWWLLNSIIIIASFLCYKLHVFHEIYQKDSSFLCFVIMFLFILVSCYNGKIASTIYEEKDVGRQIEFSWFFSEICLSLGMIGTVVGFIQMLSGFSTLSPGNSTAIQSLIVSMSHGMSTALYTTLAGLIFGNILKLQAFDLENCVQKLKEANEKK